MFHRGSYFYFLRNLKHKTFGFWAKVWDLSFIDEPNWTWKTSFWKQCSKFRKHKNSKKESPNSSKRNEKKSFKKNTFLPKVKLNRRPLIISLGFAPWKKRRQNFKSKPLWIGSENAKIHDALQTHEKRSVYVHWICGYKITHTFERLTVQ